MPTIRVDDEVFKELQRRAEAFVDSPNTVLRRLLRLPRPIRRVVTRPRATSTRTTRTRATRRSFLGRVEPGSILAQGEYRQPILDCLVAKGGQGSVADVLTCVRSKLKNRLTFMDLEPKQSSSEERWRNRAQWERRQMVVEGLVDPEAPRGVWRLTDAGWRAAGGSRPRRGAL